MRNFKADQYLELMGNTEDPVIKKNMSAELSVISKVENPKSKTFIDMGAGYGRVTSFLSEKGKNVIAIEINAGMLVGLHEFAKTHDNVIVVNDDFNHLSKVVEAQEVSHPVLLLLQNTFGTIEGGKHDNVLKEMKAVASKHNGEIIISLFRQEAMSSWGSIFYNNLKEMVGEINPNKTDFNNGIFTSKTGYVSKWNNTGQIRQMISYFNGNILNEIWCDEYCIIHIGFD